MTYLSKVFFNKTKIISELLDHGLDIESLDYFAEAGQLFWDFDNRDEAISAAHYGLPSEACEKIESLNEKQWDHLRATITLIQYSMGLPNYLERLLDKQPNIFEDADKGGSGNLYRAMSLDEKDLKKLLSSGIDASHGRASSWTKSEGFAEEFGKEEQIGRKGKYLVILEKKVPESDRIVCFTNEKIPSLYQDEDEVLCKSFKVNKNDVKKIFKDGVEISKEEIPIAASFLVKAEEKPVFTDGTKFFGKAGAGVVLYAKDTGNIGIQQRSAAVNEPLTWGTWGGSLDKSETPKAGALRELMEESGYTGEIELEELHVFKDEKFKYHNFLGTVPSEFTPTLSWESSAYIWTTLDKLPSPLHYGFRDLLPHLKSKLEKDKVAS